MTCVKTGCSVRLPDGRFAYGDAHQFPEGSGPFAFRFVAVSDYGGRPFLHVLHYQLLTWEHWFEEHKVEGTSTMIALPEQVIFLGYDGKSLNPEG